MNIKIISNLLKKYRSTHYYFIKYKNEKLGEITTLAVQCGDLDYIDIYNKEMISCFGHSYKTRLNEYVNIKQDYITPKTAKKIAQNYYGVYKIFVEEQEELEHPNKFKLKEKVEHNNNNGDIYI